jgi:hypothetical protein
VLESSGDRKKTSPIQIYKAAAAAYLAEYIQHLFTPIRQPKTVSRRGLRMRRGRRMRPRRAGHRDSHRMLRPPPVRAGHRPRHGGSPPCVRVNVLGSLRANVGVEPVSAYMTGFAARAYPPLFDRDDLRQVSRIVRVVPVFRGNEITQQLYNAVREEAAKRAVFVDC